MIFLVFHCIHYHQFFLVLWWRTHTSHYNWRVVWSLTILVSCRRWWNNIIISKVYFIYILFCWKNHIGVALWAQVCFLERWLYWSSSKETTAFLFLKDTVSFNSLYQAVLLYFKTPVLPIVSPLEKTGSGNNGWSAMTVFKWLQKSFFNQLAWYISMKFMQHWFSQIILGAFSP